MSENQSELEKKYAALCRIVRANHFAWREAVLDAYPDAASRKLINHVREIQGREIVEAFVQTMDLSKPLPPQVATILVETRRAMGESPSLEVIGDGDEVYVNTTACPWHGLHKVKGLESEDREACDAWFHSVVDHLNQKLNTRLKVETCEAKNEGCERCRRRIWVEENPEFF